MNYCCARGDCEIDRRLWAEARERARRVKAREDFRVLAGNEKRPPEKQNKVVDEIVKLLGPYRIFPWEQP